MQGTIATSMSFSFLIRDIYFQIVYFHKEERDLPALNASEGPYSRNAMYRSCKNGETGLYCFVNVFREIKIGICEKRQ